MPLRRMKGQRREHRPGDLFVVQLDQDGSYRFGRVVKTGESTPEARFHGDAMVYLYDVPFAEPRLVDRDVLTRDRLLIPPEFATKWMWHKGYFRTVDHQPLEPVHLLAQHCFYDSYYKWYVDENAQQLDRRYEPCGSFGLPVFEWVEEQIDAALAGDPIAAPYPPSERSTPPKE